MPTIQLKSFIETELILMIATPSRISPASLVPNVIVKVAVYLFIISIRVVEVLIISIGVVKGFIIFIIIKWVITKFLN